MGNNSKIYEAAVVRSLVNGGQRLPEIKEIVRNILMRNDELKKEELNQAVHKEILKIVKIAFDDSIASQIGSALKKLEKENEVKHLCHGYWISQN